MNYYEVLGVANDATEQDIKRAYAIKLRQYPPEQHPEAFDRVRKAYEILGSADSRREYDTMSVHGEEVNRLMEAGSALLDEERFEEAAMQYKKVLLIDENLHYARNMYALTLSYCELHDKALSQFDRLVEAEPDNSTYHYNRAHVLQKLNRLRDAEAAYRLANRLAPHNFQIVLDWAELYRAQGDMDKARALLDGAAGLCGEDDFQTAFVYLFKRLKLEAMEKNEQAIQSVFWKIEALLTKHPEEQAFAAGQYAEFAFELYEYKLYVWAEKFTARAVQLNPDQETIRKLHEEITERRPVYAEQERLKDDPAINEYIKQMYLLDLFGDEVETEQYEAYNEQVRENLLLSAKFDYDSIIASVKRLIIHYPHLYEFRKSFLQPLIELAKHRQSLMQQYDKLQADTTVIQPLKRLVALQMSEDMPEHERRRHFDDAIGEMSQYAPDSVHRSVERLRAQYKLCHELNPELFDEIGRRAASAGGAAGQAARAGSGRAAQSPGASRGPGAPGASGGSAGRGPSAHSGVGGGPGRQSGAGGPGRTGQQQSGAGGPGRPAPQQSGAGGPGRPVPQQSGTGSSSCFVATVSYGTPLAEELDVLRSWRDTVLSRFFFGRMFIRVYYKYGPSWAVWVGKSELRKQTVRRFLGRLVARLEKD